MTIAGHPDRSVFTRYNVRRDDVQTHGLAQQESYLAMKRATTTTPPQLKKPGRRS